MKDDVKGLAGVCVASLAMMAVMVALGVSGMPSLATAQTGMLASTCSSAGLPGCYDCNNQTANSSSNGQGCNGTTVPPKVGTNQYVVGACISSDVFANTCTSWSMNCGKWIYCKDQTLSGGNCTTLPICY